MRLTETDASFIYMETASSPMHISSVYVLKGEVPFEDIYKHYENRIHHTLNKSLKVLLSVFENQHSDNEQARAALAPSMHKL